MASRQYKADAEPSFKQVQAEIALRERSKELECIYELVQIIAENTTGDELVFEKIAQLLPSAWLYPENTWSRIRINDKEFVSGVPGFAATMQAPLTAKGKVVGAIEVGYRAARPSQFEGPFLKEERRLLNAIAQIVSLLIERDYRQAY